MRREQRQRVRELRKQRNELLQKLDYLKQQIAILGVAAPFALILEKEQTEEQIKAVEHELDELLGTPSADANPYVGLRTFEENDAYLFFGREALTAELVDKVRQWPFLAVMGPSGSGKSSVVRAGLIPELKGGALPGSESWLYATFKPGARPLDALAVALAQVKTGDSVEAVLSMRRLLAEDERGLLLAADLLLGDRANRRLVLVVDQAEELITLAPADKDTRANHERDQSGPFVRQLLTAVAAGQTPLCLIITLRADFLHRVAEYPELARWIAEHDVIVSAMTPEELTSAIFDPTLEAGGEFEAGLVEELVDQVAGKPGALPLLEYTLAKLWEERDGEGVMTWAAYRAMGSVEGALAARADAILHEKYGESEREQLRHLLLKLIQPGEGALDSRRRALLDDLTPAGHTPAEVQALLKPLVDERLLTTGRDPATGGETAEVSHEALIRAWPTLREWIENGREDLRFQLQVEEAAREWEASEDNEDFLWGGLRLENAEAWLARAEPQLSEREDLFLAASRAVKTRREQEAEAARREREALLEAKAEEARKRAEAERKNSNRLRIFVGVGAVLLAIAVLLGLFAWNKASEARQAQKVAEDQTQLAQANAVKAQTSEAAAIKAQNEAEWQGRRSAAGELAAQAKIAMDEHPEDPDLAILLARRAMTTTLEEDGYIHPQASDALMEAMAKAWPWRLVAGSENGRLRNVKLSPTGTQLLTNDRNDESHIWDLETGQEINKPDGMRTGFSSYFFSDDGALLATDGGKGLQIWDTKTWELRHDLKLTEVGASVGWFSPDNTLLMTFGSDQLASLWNLLTAEQVPIPKIESDEAYFSSDSERMLLLRRSEASCRLLDTMTGDEIPLEDGICAIGDDIGFGGRLLAITDNSGSYRVANTRSGRPLRPLGEGAKLRHLDFNRDRSQLAAVSEDGRAVILNTDTGEMMLRLTGRNIAQVWFSNTGKYLLVRAKDGSARLLQGDNLQEVRSVGKIRGERQRFDASDARLLVISDDDTAGLWDVEGKEEPYRVEIDGRVDFARFSNDGSRILIHTIDGQVVIEDAESHESYFGADKITYADSLVISPSGQYLCDESRIWNVDVGADLISGRQIDGCEFSADGRIVVVWIDFFPLVFDMTADIQLMGLGGEGDYQTIEFSGDSNRILTMGESVTVWDAETGKKISSREQDLMLFAGNYAVGSDLIAFVEDEVFFVENERGTQLWNFRTGESSEIDLVEYDNIKISNDDKSLAIVTEERVLHVIDVLTEKERFSVRNVNEFVISPDSELIGIITQTGELRVIEGISGAEISPFLEIEEVKRLEFSDDSIKLAVWDEDYSLHIFDLVAGRNVLDSIGPGIADIEFSSDGDFALALNDSQIPRTSRLFDLRDGMESFAESDLGRLLSMSSDGAFVALHDAQAQKLIIANTESGQEVTSFDTQGTVDEVYFSLDNRLLTFEDATGADIWDIREGRLLWQLGGESLNPDRPAFSPDGQYVLTFVNGSYPRLRPSYPERLLTLSAPLIQRDPPALTPEELQRYGLD